MIDRCNSLICSSFFRIESRYCTRKIKSIIYISWKSWYFLWSMFWNLWCLAWIHAHSCRSSFCTRLLSLNRLCIIYFVYLIINNTTPPLHRPPGGTAPAPQPTPVERAKSTLIYICASYFIKPCSPIQLFFLLN